MPDSTYLDTVFSSYNLTRRDVAEVLGLTTAAIDLWCNGKRMLRAETAVQIEKLLKVPRHKLRPDLWPEPIGAAKAAQTSGVEPCRSL